MRVQLLVRLVPSQLRGSILARQNNLTNKKYKMVLDYRKWQRLKVASPSLEMERTQSDTESCSRRTRSAYEVNWPANQITLSILNLRFISIWRHPRYISFGVILTGRTH